MEGYQVVFEHQVLFRDLDAMGHVNNVTFVSFMEDARVQYWKALKNNRDLQGINFIIAKITCSYRSPAYFGETLLIGITGIDHNEMVKVLGCIIKGGCVDTQPINFAEPAEAPPTRGRSRNAAGGQAPQHWIPAGTTSKPATRKDQTGAEVIPLDEDEMIEL